jgi:hypothetical protein
MKIRLFADFNNRDASDRVCLNTVGSKDDMAKASVAFCEGMEVILYDDEIEVNAQLEKEKSSGEWIGLIDWSTRRAIHD